MRNQEFDESDQQRKTSVAPDDDTGDGGAGRFAEDGEGREYQVANQRKPEPIREQEEQELSEDDLLEYDDFDDMEGEGPDA